MVHGSVKSLLRAIASITMLACVGFALLTWRLSTGPIAIGSLAPYIAQSIGSSSQFTFDIRTAVLSWGRISEPPEVRILDIAVIDDTENIVAAFPELAISLSLTAVLDGTLAPESVILINPTVRLSRLVDGSFAVGIEPALPRASQLIELSQEEKLNGANLVLDLLLDAVTDEAAADNPGGYLKRAVVRDAAVVFYDQASAVEWLFPSGYAELERAEEGIVLQATLPFANGDIDSTITMEGLVHPNREESKISVEFSQVKPSIFSPLAPDIEFLRGLGVHLSGKADLAIALQDQGLFVQEVNLDVLSGRGTLDLPTPIQREYAIQDLTFSLSARNNFDSVEIESSSIVVEGRGDEVTTINLTGEAIGLLSGPSAVLDIGIGRLALDDLKAFWPEDIKPNTRNWITRNLDGGFVSGADFDVQLAGDSIADLQVDQFFGEAFLAEIDVNYIRGMPPAESVNGEMTLGLEEVGITILGGQVTRLATMGELNISSGEIRLHGLATREHKADIDLVISGHLQDAISLIDEEPLRYARALGITPSSTSGQAEVLLSIDFPLVQDLTLEQVAVSAQAAVENTRIENAVLGLPLESGQFSLSLNNSGMDVSGTASIGGIRAGLTWRENFQTANVKRQYAVDAILENDQRALVNLGHSAFAPPYLDGPVRVEAIYTIDEASKAKLDLEADITAASIEVPQLNWSKSRDMPGFFSAQLGISEEKLQSVKDLRLESRDAGLNVRGQIEFSETGEFESLDLVDSQVGKSEFSVFASRTQSDKLDIKVESRVLDGSSFWQSVLQNDRARSFGEESRVTKRPEFQFSGRIARLLLSPSGEIRDVQSEIEQESGGLSRLKIEGLVDSGESFLLSMDPADSGSRVFKAESQDGGAVLRALGLGDDFVAGQLVADGTINELGAVEGNFSIKSFKVVDAPLLARLLSVASLTGIVDELEGNGISFTELNLPFSYSENVFRIDNGAMYGPSLGLTARGKYDTIRETLDGEGTLIPAYAVNSAVGSIPILGPILTGGEKSGGVFAATYTMRGNPEGGEITVNPLATLTPGFLRQIFRIFDPPPSEPSAVQDSAKTEG